ncbi:MAG: autotransporter outer membrane beta-barrel domain-containing protein [Akkermansia sp.]
MNDLTTAGVGDEKILENRYVGTYSQAENGSGQTFGRGDIVVSGGSTFTVSCGDFLMSEASLTAEGAGTMVQIQGAADLGKGENSTSRIAVLGGATMEFNLKGFDANTGVSSSFYLTIQGEGSVMRHVSGDYKAEFGRFLHSTSVIEVCEGGKLLLENVMSRFGLYSDIGSRVSLSVDALSQMTASDMEVGYGAVVDNKGQMTVQSLIQTAGQITNSGTMEILGTLSVKENGKLTVSESGILKVAGALTNAGTIQLYGQSELAGTLTNSGTLQLYKGLDASSLDGDGETEICINRGTRDFIGTGSAVLSLNTLSDDQTVSVTIDLKDPLSLIGKRYDFLEVGGVKKALNCNDIKAEHAENATFDWDNYNGLLSYDGGKLGMGSTDFDSATNTLTNCGFKYWVDAVNQKNIGGVNYAPGMGYIDIGNTPDGEYRYVTIPSTDGSGSVMSVFSQNVSAAGEYTCALVFAGMEQSDGTYTPVQVNGTILLLNRETTLSGDPNKESVFGFGFESAGNAIGTNGLQKGMIDIALVKDSVTMKDLTMNVGQRLEVDAGQSLTLTNTILNIGGGDAKDLSTITVGGATHQLGSSDVLKLDSQKTTIADGATLKLTNSTLAGTKLTNGSGDIQVGAATITLKDSKLGSSDAAAMSITLTDSRVSGTGSMHKVSMNGGSLTIGNSPGQMSIEGVSATNSSWSFYFITDAPTWNPTGANDTTNPTTGAFSQLKALSGNSASGITVSIVYEDASGAAKSKEDFTATLGAGFSVKLIDGVENLTFSGNNVVDRNSLPTLREGLFWDTDSLFRTGCLYVISHADIMVADAGRLANTLVSAADTTVFFGRMAREHYKDARRQRANVWAGGFGTYLNHADAGGRSGFEYNTHGYAIGADTELAEGLVAGLGLGQSFGKHKPNRGDAFYNAGEIDQDGLLAALYAAKAFACAKSDNELLLDGYVAYGRYDNSSTRRSLSNGSTARADWKENTLAAGATLTRLIKLQGGAELTPFVGAEYRWADMEDATEHNHSSMRYEGSAYQNLSLSVGIGCRKSYALTAVQKLTPYASVAYVGDALREDGEVTAHGSAGEVLREKSAAHGRHALQLNAGALWQITDEWAARAGYTGELREGADDHNVNLSATYSF